MNVKTTNIRFTDVWLMDIWFTCLTYGLKAYGLQDYYSSGNIRRISDIDVWQTEVKITYIRLTNVYQTDFWL